MVEVVAFRKLTAFASKVAGELAEANVPHDTYVAQKAHKVCVEVRSGLFGLGTKTVVSLVPDRHVEIAGWRVLSEVNETKTLLDVAGTIRSYRFHELDFEVWLERSGGLVAVWLSHERVSNSFRGSIDNVVPTKLTSDSFKLNDALRLDGSSAWRTRDYTQNGIQFIEEWREYRPRNNQVPACLRVSTLLAELRKRAL